MPSSVLCYSSAVQCHAAVPAMEEIWRQLCGMFFGVKLSVWQRLVTLV